MKDRWKRLWKLYTRLTLITIIVYNLSSYKVLDCTQIIACPGQRTNWAWHSRIWVLPFGKSAQFNWCVTGFRNLTKISHLCWSNVLYSFKTYLSFHRTMPVPGQPLPDPKINVSWQKSTSYQRVSSFLRICQWKYFLLLNQQAAIFQFKLSLREDKVIKRHSFLVWLLVLHSFYLLS